MCQFLMAAYMLVAFFFSPALNVRFNMYNADTCIGTVLHSKRAYGLVFYKGSINEGPVFLKSERGSSSWSH